MPRLRNNRGAAAVVDDPHTNRFLLLSIFALGGILLYLTTHRPEQHPTATTRATTTTKLYGERRLRDDGESVLVFKNDGDKVAYRDDDDDEQPTERSAITHRIVAIGDIHGDFSALTKILRRAEIVDQKGHWIANSTVLVQTGDIVDRGVDTIACYRFMQSLRLMAERAGGAVVSLLGNHEIMNALGDWRYVNAHDIKSFGGERNRREAMSTGWIGEEWRANYSVTARVPYLHRQSPHGLVETRQDGAARFLVEPRRGLSSRPFEHDLDLDGAISFVHGGIIPEYLDTIEDRDDGPVSAMNRIGSELLDLLVDEPFPISLPRRASREVREWWSERGPMWNRDWALHDEPEVCRRVDRTLERLRVRRVVMGHTPHFAGIVSRCRGKILLIDTGISRAYGGAHSFLDVRHTLSPSLTVDGDWHEREVVKAVYEHRENVTTALLETDCPNLKLLARGKVRDIYEVPGHDEALLFVATDRVSAFDVIMKNGIPNKGKLLTSLSLFFFDLLAKSPRTRHIPNHVITSDITEMPQAVQEYRDQLEGRSIWVRRAQVLPVEAIVRGYITGSAWAEYERTGTMHGIQLATGLKESSKFEPPLFTPSTKAEVGDKDENIHPDQLAKHLPSPDLAKPLESYALALYSTAAEHSLSKGLILADTKFEFGLLPSPEDGGEPTLILVDECLTPDSSRFWPAKTWSEGTRMVGFDKQFLREWLKQGGGGFGNKGGGIDEDGVEIPTEIVNATWQKYEEAYEMLTGTKFSC